MKVELKLKQRHPANKMKLGRHTITNRFKEFDLNEKELKELETKGPKHWFAVKAPKKKDKK